MTTKPDGTPWELTREQLGTKDGMPMPPNKPETLDAKGILARLIENKEVKLPYSEANVDLIIALVNHLNVLKSKEKTLVEGLGLEFNRFIIKSEIVTTPSRLNSDTATFQPVKYFRIYSTPPAEGMKFEILE
jgi:hypothetical protein